MKLLVSETSPYARKARIVIRENQLMDKVSEVMVKTSPLDTNPELKAANPLGKIPCLIHDEGFAIFDSRVICRYLDDKSTAAHLHPSRNYKHETFMALSDGILDAAVSAAYERLMRPKSHQFEPWIESQLGKIVEALKFTERDFMDVLSHINMGALTLVCALEYLDMRHNDLGWRQITPQLAQWYEAQKDRESVKATRPPKP